MTYSFLLTQGISILIGLLEYIGSVCVDEIELVSLWCGEDKDGKYIAAVATASTSFQFRPLT